MAVRYGEQTNDILSIQANKNEKINLRVAQYGGAFALTGVTEEKKYYIF